MASGVFCVPLSSSTESLHLNEPWDSAVVQEDTLINEFNEPSILAACREGKVEIVKHELAQNPGAVNNPYHSGKSGEMVCLLYIASQYGHAEVVKVLIENGANTDTIWNDKTALLKIIQNEHAKVVKVLIANERNIDHNMMLLLFFQASMNGKCDVVKVLIPNIENIDHIINSDPTLILQASQNGHSEVVKVLIENGANVNTVWNGQTPLFQACEYGHSEVVKVLIENGADPTVKCKSSDGRTRSCLDIAKQYEKIVSELKSAISLWNEKGKPQKLPIDIPQWRISPILVGASQLLDKSERASFSVNHQACKAHGDHKTDTTA